jgi:hypothetical protein
MPGNCCKKSGHKHTPIVSKAQQGKFGAELARRQSGKQSQMKGITIEELRSHLKESKGKHLPARAKLRSALKQNKK